MKYYAVRKGRRTGIFTSWDECQASIKGFSGAEYKSFSSLEEAQKYLNGDIEIDDTMQKEIQLTKSLSSQPDEIVIYVDGSFDKEKNMYKYAFLVVKNNQIVYEEQGSNNKKEALSIRQVSGELLL